MYQIQDLPLRQFQQDYLIASGYYYIDTTKEGIHVFKRGKELIHVLGGHTTLLAYYNGSYSNSIGNVTALDNILNFAMALHAIGAINLKDNFRLAHEETAKAEFQF